jgi:hypothetical protein
MHYLARYINLNRVRAISAGILLGSALPYSQLLITLRGIHKVQILIMQLSIAIDLE